VKLTINFEAYVNPPDRVEARKSYDWVTGLMEGKILVEVYVPPSAQWYSQEIELTRSRLDTIDSKIKIPIMTGLSITLDLTPSASLELRGSAVLSSTKLLWNQPNINVYSRKIFTVSCNENSAGSTIILDANYFLELNAQLILDLTLFEQEITEIPVLQIPLTPTVSETITVSQPPTFLDQMLTFAFSPMGIIMGFLLFIILIAIIAGVIRGRKIKRERKNINKETRTKPVTKPQKPTQKKRLNYCIHCGEKLPLEATFCDNCGKRVN